MALSCDSLEGSSRGLGAKINKSSKNIHSFYDKSLKWHCIGQPKLTSDGVERQGLLYSDSSTFPGGFQQLGCATEEMRSLIHPCSLK